MLWTITPFVTLYRISPLLSGFRLCSEPSAGHAQAHERRAGVLAQMQIKWGYSQATVKWQLDFQPRPSRLGSSTV